MPRKKSHKGKGAAIAETNRSPAPGLHSEGGWVNDFEWKNERFEQYYSRQGILHDHEQWTQFMNALRRPLPSNFRLPEGKPTTPVLADQIDNLYIPSLSHVLFEGNQLDPPFKLPWYPHGLAYQLNAPKRVLRKCPEFKRFHEFLIYETNVGNVSRQEAVSMVPPLLLEVQPHHIVLDTCASPGSKTAQIIEALHSDGNPIPTGVVIANDSDYSRAGMLVHQSARLPSPCLMVTNLDASCYPNLQIRDLEGSVTKVLQFDRILCDVPCSGDGTLRKNVGIWKHWNVGNGNGLHSLQLRILQRAMRMLKPGGRIVYSTCSMNPVENEAVVAAAINTSGDGFSVLDVSDKLSGLERRPGLSSWIPAVPLRSVSGTGTEQRQDVRNRGEESSPGNTENSEFLFFSSYNDYLEVIASSKHGKVQLQETHWPPENAETLGLERCLRIYPHLQDTGGFFVAVLQKAILSPTEVATLTSPENEGSLPATLTKRPAPSETKSDSSPKRAKIVHYEESRASGQIQDSGGAATNADNPKRRKPGKGRVEGDNDNIGTEGSIGNFNENPYTFLNPLDPIIKESLSKLGIAASFPSGNLFVRNPAGEAARTMYLCNDIVKQIVSLNAFERIRLVSCGLKMFARQEGGPKEAEDALDAGFSVPTGRNTTFRFVHDGVLAVQDFVAPELKIVCSLAELRCLLETYYPLITQFSEPFRNTMQNNPIGSYLAVVQPSDHQGASLKHPLVLPLWRSGVSLSLMIDKQAKTALSIRLWGNDYTVAGRVATSEQGGIDHGRDNRK